MVHSIREIKKWRSWTADFPSRARSSVAIRPVSLVPAVFRSTTYCFCYPRSRQATPRSESVKEPLEKRVQAEDVA